MQNFTDFILGIVAAVLAWLGISQTKKRQYAEDQENMRSLISEGDRRLHERVDECIKEERYHRDMENLRKDIKDGLLSVGADFQEVRKSLKRIELNMKDKADKQ